MFLKDGTKVRVEGPDFELPPGTKIEDPEADRTKDNTKDKKTTTNKTKKKPPKPTQVKSKSNKKGKPTKSKAKVTEPLEKVSKKDVKIILNEKEIAMDKNIREMLMKSRQGLVDNEKEATERYVNIIEEPKSAYQKKTNGNVYRKLAEVGEGNRQVRQAFLIRKAKKNFFDFCVIMDYNNNRGREVFTKDKKYLKNICDTLQSLYEKKLLKPNGKPYKKLQLNCPPGFAKSYTLILFSQWVFGKNRNNEIITVSYNEKITTKFGQSVRDGIEQEQSIEDISYHDIFPNTMIKQGDSSKRDWSLEGRHHSYLATSFKSTLTGMRGNIGIIDDPIKSAYEASNIDILEEHWDWYKNTFLSRMVEGSIQIVVQTRWSTNDLCGKLLEAQPDDWYIIKLEAKDIETGVLLSPSLLSEETYNEIRQTMSPEIFAANYHQTPVDIQGRLYSEFMTYTDIPEKEDGIYCQVDTADTGKDALVAIVYSRVKGLAYVLDVYHTKEPMEITEPYLAAMLYNYNVKEVEIESNNGGRGFARNVEKLLYDNHRSRSVKFKWFHQSLNKKTKILTNATTVMNSILLPIGWKSKYKNFFIELSGYQRSGKNAFDDCADVLSEIALRLSNEKKVIVTSKHRLGIR